MARWFGFGGRHSRTYFEEFTYQWGERTSGDERLALIDGLCAVIGDAMHDREDQARRRAMQEAQNQLMQSVKSQAPQLNLDLRNLADSHAMARWRECKQRAQVREDQLLRSGGDPGSMFKDWIAKYDGKQ